MENPLSQSESEQDFSSEEETGDETEIPRNQEKISDYENQRLKRIEENKKRMEALGLHKMATSFMGSVQKTQKMDKDKKGKRKVVDEDEEYNPTQDDEETSSSAEEEDDDDFSQSKRRGRKNSSTPKKPRPIQKPVFESDFVDDDEALMQAIALSLHDNAGFLDLRNSSPRSTKNAGSKKIKENPCIQEDSGKRKRKKSITSRVQMTEDEMLMHYFQFDETGRGGLTLRDIQRLAAAHDFTWSEKEMADMVCCFDSNGDGKISLDDFRKIVCRCNMLKDPDYGVNGQ